MRAHSLRPAALGRGMQPQMDIVLTGAALPAGVTFSRATTATDGLYTDLPGSGYNTYAIDQPRLLGARGLLIESARTQRLRNSIAPAAHTTFNLPVSTYSFWLVGTGTATIAPNTAVGTGWGTISAGMWANIIVTTAGTANVTVSGSVERFQLEASQWPTSFIPNTTAASARNGDVCSVPFTFPSWRQMSMLAEGSLFFLPSGVANTWLAHIGDGAALVGFGVKRTTNGLDYVSGNMTGGSMDLSGIVLDQELKLGASGNGTRLVVVGRTGGQWMPPVGNPSATVRGVEKPLNTLFLGGLNASGAQGWSGFVKRVRYWGFPITPRQFEQMMRE